MAEYKLGVDNQNVVKIYTGNTAPTGITQIGSISGLKTGLAATAGQAYSLPSGITANATGDSGEKTVTVTLGTGANSQTDESLTITVSGTDNNTITLESNVTREHTGYSVTPGTGQIDIKNTFSAGWKLSGISSATYAAAGDGDDNVVTVSGLKNAAITSDDYTFDMSKNSNKIITLKASALEGVTGNVDASNSNGFKLAIDDSLVAKTAAETDFMWTATEVVATQSAPASTTMTLTKELNAGWTKNDAANTTTLTYRAAGSITYATIAGLAAGAKAADMPNLNTANNNSKVADADVTKNGTPYTLTLTADVLPTVDAAKVTLTDGSQQNIDGTSLTPNFSLSTTGFNTAAETIRGGYSLGVDNSGTATVKQMIYEYWEPASGNETLTHHTEQAAADAFVSIAGLNKDAKFALDTDASVANADIVFDTSNSNEIMLKASALDDKTVTLTNSGTTLYHLKIGNGIASPGATHGDLGVSVSGTGTDALVTVQADKGYSLGTAPTGDTKTQELTYGASATVTLATIAGVASGVAASNFTFSGATITLNKNVLPDSAAANATVTVTENTEDDNKYQDEYDFKLAIHEDVAEYGEGEKTPTLVVNAKSTEEGADETGDMTARIQVTESKGWKLGENDTIIAMTAAASVDVVKLIGLGASAADDYDNDPTNGYDYVNFDKANKLIKVKQAALDSLNAKLITVNTVDTVYSGYKIVFDGDVDKPGTKVVEDSAEISVGSGEATITGTLNEGWTLDSTSAVITYTASKENQTLAQISGLSDGATDDEVGFGEDDPQTDDIDESKIVYLSLDALMDGHVALANKTINTTVDGATLGTYTGDFALGLLDSNSATVASLGYAHTHDWVFTNDDSTAASYNEGTKKGWSVSNGGLSVIFDAEITPGASSATKLMTVTGLKGGENATIGKVEITSNESVAAIGTTVDGEFVGGLWIGTEYVASQAADAENNIEKSPEVIGIVNVNRTVLDDSADGKTLTIAPTDDFGKYGLSLYTDTDGGASAYVPTKVVDKYIWEVSENHGEQFASYKIAKAEYWSLGSDSKSVTYHAQTSGTPLAKITGISAGLSAVQGNDFAFHEAATDDPYVITGSFIYNPDNVSDLPTDSDAVISVTTDYLQDSDEQTEGNQEQIGVIELKAGALAQKNVTFTTGSASYSLALDSTDTDLAELEFEDPSWSVTGTTATYLREVKTAGYSATGESAGNQIIYMAEGGASKLAIISGLKSGIAVDTPEGGTDEVVGISVAGAFSQGIEVDESGEYPVFTINGNILDSTTVTLEDVAGASYTLAIGEGALDYGNADDKARVDSGVNVWQFTKTSKGVITAATYGSVQPSSYIVKDNGLSIENKAETGYKTYVTLKNFKFQDSGADNIVIKTTALDAAEFSSEIGYINDDNDFVKGLSVAEDSVNGNSIIVLANEMLDSTQTATLTDGAKKYTFALGENVSVVGIEDNTASWAVENGTAVLTANLTEGWGVDNDNSNGKAINHYNEIKDKVIVTINGLSAGTTTLDADLPTLSGGAIDMSGSFSLSADTFNGTNVTLTNGINSDGKKFTFGIALDEYSKTATEAARTGVARWYLKDATTLDYSTIHDAHYEDHGISSAIDTTTIKFVDEAVGTNIASITNLKAGATLTSKVDGTVGEYYKNGDTADGMPVDGVTISDNNITVTSTVLNKDATKPLTLTNGTGGAFTLKGDGTTVKVGTQTVNYFEVDGTNAKLNQGIEEGFKTRTTSTGGTITYTPPEYQKTLATISGIKSGLVAGTNGNQPAIGTKDETTGDFDKAVITSTDGQAFVLGASALDTVNVSLTGGTGYSIKLDDAVQKAWWDTDNNIGASEAYSWKVSGTTATFNKGNKEGWSDGTGDNTGKLIEYHKEDYSTLVSTVTNLASGLELSDTDKTVVLDKDGNTAITLYNTNDTDIRLYSPALTTKDVLLKREKTTGDTSTYVSDKAAKLVLFQEKEGGVEKDGYVVGKSIEGAWDASVVSGNKASYSVTTTPGHDTITSPTEDDLTVNKVKYDDRIVYTKAGKVTSTITGLKNDTATSTITRTADSTDSTNEALGAFTIPKAALADSSNVKLTNGKGNNFTIKLGADVSTVAADPVWNFKNGTATYTQAYTAGSYMPKTEGIEYTYVTEALAKKPTTLFTITGLDKTQFATSPEAGKDTAAAVATTYGIGLSTTTRQVATGEKNEDGTDKTKEKTFNTVTLDPTKVKLAAGNVVIKKGTQEYEFDLSVNGASSALAVVDYYKTDNLQWSYNKGTAILDAGKSAGWAYAVNKDKSINYTTLAYSKAAPMNVATIKGLNTNLELGDDGNIYVKPETQSNGTLAATETRTPVLTYTKHTEAADGVEATDGSIALTTDALPTTLKNNTKITLTTIKNGPAYVLDNTAIDEPETDDFYSWSIDTKGVASFQKTTHEGWTLESTGTNAGKILTYSTAKDTVYAKISGLAKDADLSLGISTYVKDTEKSTDTKTVYKADTKKASEISFITVTESATDDGENTKFTFTFDEDTTDSKTNKALTTTNVTLTQVDKKNDKNKYVITASDNIAPVSYGNKWTVVGKSGKATYTAGTNAGYTNGTGNKEGTLITYNKEKVNTTLATISGLKKDTDTTAAADKLENLFADSNVIAVKGTTINVMNADKILVAVNDKPSTVTLASKAGYTFGEVKGTNTIGTVTTQLTAKSGTVNLVNRASGGNYTLSSDSMKIVYNKAQADTILATVKGLNKDLTVNDSNKVVVGSGTTEVVKFADDTITLSADALANGKVTFTLGKGVEEGDYTLALDSTDVSRGNIMTKSGNWRGITEWTIKNGTATYKTYDKGYYYDDGKGGFAYSNESKGTTHATITGLKTDLTTIDNNVFKTSGEIKLTSDQLITSVTKNGTTTPSGKNVTLKNQSGYNFTIALDTESEKKVTESTLDDTSLAWNGGKLTATQKAGYIQASDTSITYLAKDKTNQLIATVTGIKKTATLDKPTSHKDLTINISSDDVDGKNITLTTTALAEGNFKLSLDGVAGPSIVGGATDPWSVKSSTATFTGYVATAGYTLAASGKSISYTKENGTEAKPKPLTTIKGVGTTKPTGGNSPVVSKGNITMGNGLLPVSYGGTGSVTGSKDNDSITATAAGVTVTPGKGDDYVSLTDTGNTIIYANNDGHDVIAHFASTDKITINGVNITADNITTSGTGADVNTIITVGKGSIELRGYNGEVSITDKSGTAKTYGGAADLLIDDNYSMDAAALSDIVEPFHASYTPYDFEAGLDLVKQNSFTPAITFTGNDKK